MKKINNTEKYIDILGPSEYQKIKPLSQFNY